MGIASLAPVCKSSPAPAAAIRMPPTMLRRSIDFIARSSFREAIESPDKIENCFGFDSVPPLLETPAHLERSRTRCTFVAGAGGVRPDFEIAFREIQRRPAEKRDHKFKSCNRLGLKRWFDAPVARGSTQRPRASPNRLRCNFPWPPCKRGLRPIFINYSGELAGAFSSCNECVLHRITGDRANSQHRQQRARIKEWMKTERQR